MKRIGDVLDFPSPSRSVRPAAMARRRRPQRGAVRSARTRAGCAWRSPLGIPISAGSSTASAGSPSRRSGSARRCAASRISTGSLAIHSRTSSRLPGPKRPSTSPARSPATRTPSIAGSTCAVASASGKPTSRSPRRWRSGSATGASTSRSCPISSTTCAPPSTRRGASPTTTASTRFGAPPARARRPGTENTTPWAREKLYQIINHRYVERLLTIVTSNQSHDKIDERILSRLLDTHLTRDIHIDAADYRRRERSDYTRGRRSR